MKNEWIENLDRWYEEDQSEKVLEAIEKIPEQELDYDLLSRKARALNNLGQYQAAVDVLLTLREEGERDPLWHYRLGYAYYYLDLEEQAKEELEQALDLEPNDGDFWVLLDLCCEALGVDTSRPMPQGAESLRSKSALEVYQVEEMDAVEEHITRHFGPFENVYHEIYSPDIHVDIVIVPPTPVRNFYTLVTMGMGAHVMSVPGELLSQGLGRAELLICLPPDWDIQNPDERWYWPIRLLKVLARMPGNEDTWLGWGHTVSNGKHFAENTALSGCLLTWPWLSGDPNEKGGYGGSEKASICRLPGGEQVNFYQILPLYREEMDFKIGRHTKELLERFPRNFCPVVEIDRPNHCAPHPLELRDFYEGEYSSFDALVTIWGRSNVHLQVDLPVDEVKRYALWDRYPRIEQEVAWLNENRDAAIQALLEVDGCRLTEAFIREGDCSDDGETYLLQDGQEVTLPLTEEDFCRSLYLDSVLLSFETDEPEFTLFLSCSPDYLAGHCLVLIVDEDREIIVDGMTE